MPRGVSPAIDREMGDFRVVAPVSCVIHKKNFTGDDPRSGRFLFCMYRFGPVGAFGTLRKCAFCCLDCPLGEGPFLWMFFRCTFFVDQRLVPQDHWMGNGECAMLEQQE